MSEAGETRGGTLLRAHPESVPAPMPVPGTRPPQSVEIPARLAGSWTARAPLAQPHGPAAEHFRHFALRLTRLLEARGGRSVAATSALRGEGKTTVACNLALALATLGERSRIALVDLDLRRPRVASALGVEARVGIESVLRGEAELDAARLSTQLPALDLFLAKRASPAAHGLFGSAAADVLGALTERYEIVLVDTPPILLVPDVALLLPHLSAYFTVVRLGVTRRAALSRALEELPKESRLGVFVNHMPRPRYYMHYGYYADE
jgi:Mrp family chromosome partitioning ATPase